jgi:hypothetical protein
VLTSGYRPTPSAYKSLEQEAIDGKLEEMDKTCRTIEHGGYYFSVGTLNDASDRKYQSFCSTAGSGIAGGRPNPGNAYEFATCAAANPTQPMVYISSFGNGTRQLGGHSALLFMRTGRMTKEGADDRGTQGSYAIQCLARALVKEGIIVDKPTGDSLGSIMASALGTELGRLGYPVTHCFLDKVPRLTGNTWFGMTQTIWRDRYEEKIRRESKTADRFSVLYGGPEHEQEVAARVKKCMPNVYRGGVREFMRKVAWFAGAGGKLAIAGGGCSHGLASL